MMNEWGWRANEGEQWNDKHGEEVGGVSAKWTRRQGFNLALQ